MGVVFCLFSLVFLELSVYEQRYDQNQGWWQERTEKNVLKSPVCYPVSGTTLKEQSCDFKLCPPAWQFCVAPCDPTDCHCCRTIAGDSLCLRKTNWYPEIRFVFQFQAPYRLSHTEECSMLASLIVITVLFIFAINFMARTILYLFSFLFFFLSDCCWLLLQWNICPSRRTDRQCTRISVQHRNIQSPLGKQISSNDTLVLLKHVILAYEVTNTCTHGLWNVTYPLKIIFFMCPWKFYLIKTDKVVFTLPFLFFLPPEESGANILLHQIPANRQMLGNTLFLRVQAI